MVYAFFILSAYAVSFLLCVFVNRVPNNRKLLKFESLCPSCNHHIGWYYHLPIIGFFVSKKYPCCGNKNAIYNLLIPLLAMILFPLTYVISPTIYECLGEKSYLDNAQLVLAILMCGFVSVLLTVVFIDMNYMIIPDRCHVAIFILSALLVSFGYVLWFQALLSGVVYFVVFYFIAFAAEKVAKKEALGGGDIKLMGVIGTFLGFGPTLVGLMLACFICLILESILVKIKLKEKGYFAFGPYLALGMIVAMFFGLQIIEGYLKIMGIS